MFDNLFCMKIISNPYVYIIWFRYNSDVDIIELQYNPNVWKGNNYGTQFQNINQAYEVTQLPMNNFCKPQGIA